MVSDTISPSGREIRSLRHICEGCGTPLVLPVSRAGVSGPCPKCRNWIDASKFVFPEMPCPSSIHGLARSPLPSPAASPLPSPAALPPLLSPQIPPPVAAASVNPPTKRRMQPLAGGRGHVRADGFLDHEYNERRELFGTLRVLAVSLLVAAVILFITLYLRDWMMK